MEKLQWTGQKAYNDAKFVDWKVDGKAAGYTKAAGNLAVSFSSSRGRDVKLMFRWSRSLVLVRHDSYNSLSVGWLLIYRPHGSL
jgi:D-alanyl-D-alanine carboxypeptidase